MSATLFDLPEETPKPVEQAKGPIGEKCKNCIHLYRHNYNQNMKYCGKKRETRYKTSYGDKKIKSNDPACEMFEKIVKP